MHITDGPQSSLDKALSHAIQRQIIFGKVSYVLEADIQDYFGSVVREKLAQMLRKRIVHGGTLPP